MHSSVDGVASTFQESWITLLRIWSTTIWDPACVYSCVYTPRTGIAGSFDHSIFNFLGYCHTVFNCSYTILIFPFSPHPHQHFFPPFFMIITILTGMKGYFTVLICISSGPNNAEHLFLCLLTICRTSLERYPFKYIVYSKNQVLSWVLVFFYSFLKTPHSLQYLSSPTRDWTWAPTVKKLCIPTSGPPILTSGPSFSPLYILYQIRSDQSLSRLTPY